MDHFQIPNMPKIPPKIHQILEQLAAMSKEGEINFAFAFAYPDRKGRQWFEAHTGGTLKILRPLFEHDTNAEALLQLDQMKGDPDQKLYIHLPPICIKPK